jgi:hypothetical protein
MENNMKDICIQCYNEPNSHSFKKIRETETKIVYYTCVSEARKYDDNEGILNHYKNLLNQNKDKKWIWVFDCKDLEMKHIKNVKLAKELALLITENYLEKLQKILIVNKTWYIYILLKIVLPFFNDENRKKIKIY